MNSFKQIVLMVLIQFSLMFVAIYFWIEPESDIIKAFKLSMITPLALIIINVIRYFYRKK